MILVEEMAVSATEFFVILAFCLPHHLSKKYFRQILARRFEVHLERGAVKST
jgi:hypothetical protein